MLSCWYSISLYFQVCTLEITASALNLLYWKKAGVSHILSAAQANLSLSFINLFHFVLVHDFQPNVLFIFPILYFYSSSSPFLRWENLQLSLLSHRFRLTCIRFCYISYVTIVNISILFCQQVYISDQCKPRIQSSRSSIYIRLSRNYLGLLW